MRVSSIYINTYQRDFFFAKICISSIRYWYPDIPIILIKDMGAGDFNTKLVEKKFDVAIMDTGGKTYGWGFGKFEPLFRPETETFLFMDADTLMIGPVLDLANDVDADFIVDKEELPLDKIVSLYYDPVKLKSLDPDFNFPGYAFNTGQWIGTSGLLKKTDFDYLVSWGAKPTLKYPEIFKQADQGVFNYVLYKQEQKLALTVSRQPIMVWPAEGRSDHIGLGKIQSKEPAYPLIMHFAGMKQKNIDHLPHADIIRFFEDLYYQKVGNEKRLIDYAHNVVSKLDSYSTTFLKRITKSR